MHDICNFDTKFSTNGGKINHLFIHFYFIRRKFSIKIMIYVYIYSLSQSQYAIKADIWIQKNTFVSTFKLVGVSLHE